MSHHQLGGSMTTNNFGLNNQNFERKSSTFFHPNSSNNSRSRRTTTTSGDGQVMSPLSILSRTHSGIEGGGGENNGNLANLNHDYLRHVNLWEAASFVGLKVGGSIDHHQNVSSAAAATAASKIQFGEDRKVLRSHSNWQICMEPEDSLPAEFCKNTSLHGLKYLGQKKIHYFEKIFWTIAFTLSLSIAAYMIGAVWEKYKRSPVIVSFQPFETRNSDIPFPAITICNMNKILKTKAESYMRNARGPSKLMQVETARDNVYFMDHVCTATSCLTKRFNYSVTRGIVPESLMNLILNESTKAEADSWDVKMFLERSSQKCKNLIPLCTWEEQPTNCSDLFSSEICDFGKCCTFNMMPKELLYRNSGIVASNSSGEIQSWRAWQWDGDNLLTNKENKVRGEFPRRQKLSGKSFGLSILLNPDLHEYFCTTSDSVGFRLLAHSPIEVPRVVDFGNAIPPNSEVFINVKPTITVADDKIAGFSLDQRQCYFSDEYKLMFYSYYSRTNCLMECVGNLTFEKCKCAAYYMPRDETRDLCSRKQFRCAADIQKEMIYRGRNTLCAQCLPSCTEIKYRTEITSTPLQDPHVLWEGGILHKPKWSRSNASIVHIYFGEESTNSRLRTELFGVIDLFANFGGLMGLCLGFSGLSVIEVIYFMTLRAFCRRRHHHRIHQSASGQEEPLEVTAG